MADEVRIGNRGSAKRLLLGLGILAALLGGAALLPFGRPGGAGAAGGGGAVAATAGYQLLQHSVSPVQYNPRQFVARFRVARQDGEVIPRPPGLDVTLADTGEWLMRRYANRLSHTYVAGPDRRYWDITLTGSLKRPIPKPVSIRIQAMEPHHYPWWHGLLPGMPPRKPGWTLLPVANGVATLPVMKFPAPAPAPKREKVRRPTNRQLLWRQGQVRG